MPNVHEALVSREEGEDPRGSEVAAEAARTLGIHTSVKTANVFWVEGVDPSSMNRLTNAAFADPITESVVIDPEPEANSSPVIRVAYKPEVTDPISGTIHKVADSLGISIDAARVATQYTFNGATEEQAMQIVEHGLVNPAVQEIVKEKPETLVIKNERLPVETVSLLDATDAELYAISQERRLQLNTEEMRVIQKEARRLERDLTDVEVEILGAAWSEHCVHKTFNAEVVTKDGVKPPLFDRIKDTSRKYFGDLVATAFHDNSGGMRFYDGNVVLVKWETHNSPSALDPFGGAATGSGGVFRDILGTGQGAKIILSTDVFGIAPPDMDPEKLPPATIAPDNMLRGLVAGVRSYGNPMGVPTPNGSLHFHEDFAAKPAVLVGAYGITPEQYSQKGEPQVGDRVVAVGGRTGRDGIHGATVSSGERTAETAILDAAHVQIGNPIEEKKMVDAILEARDVNIIRALTDCGAAGFSSAIGEMGEGVGVTVDISKAPLKYEGLSPWEIWVSESQERMVLAIDPSNMEKFLAICKRHNVEATDLGMFDGSNTLTVQYGDEVVADLEYDFLKNGLPQRKMEADFMREVFEEPEVEEPTDWIGTIKKVLSHGNVCSKQPIVEQYDTTVQGTNALAPFGGVNLDAPNDAVIIRPMLDKPYGLVVSHGTNPILARIDPERGARWAAVEAVSNLVAVGGDFREMVLCGNYVSPVPDRQYMGSLDIQIDAICDFQDALGVAVVSGKDSLSATYTWPDGRKTHVPPVVNISTMGRIPDVGKTVTTDFKNEGSTLVLVGTLHKGMGGSTYFDTLNIVGNEVPSVDLEELPHVFDAVHNGIVEGQIKAAHDISEGGLITAVAEMCFGGGMGVELEINSEVRPDFFILNETPGVFVVEVESEETARALFGEVPHAVIGRTKAGNDIKVRHYERELFTADVNELKDAWQEPMRTIFH